MATDEERREAARRLRVKLAEGSPHSIHESVCYALGKTENEGNWDVISRLADLIEPSEPKVKCVAEVKVDGERLEKLAHDAAVELTGIDRDALLELADECGDASKAYAGDGHELTSKQFANVARRIRSALGMTDG